MLLKKTIISYGFEYCAKPDTLEQPDTWFVQAVQESAMTGGGRLEQIGHLGMIKLEAVPAGSVGKSHAKVPSRGSARRTPQVRELISRFVVSWYVPPDTDLAAHYEQIGHSSAFPSAIYFLLERLASREVNKVSIELANEQQSHADAARRRIELGGLGNEIDRILKEDDAGGHTGDAGYGERVMELRKSLILIKGALDNITAPASGSSTVTVTRGVAPFDDDD